MTEKLWSCRLVLQDVFELMIQCCGSSHWQNSCKLSGRLEKGRVLFCRKKSNFDTIFQPRVILGLVLHIYCPYWSLGQHLLLLRMHNIVLFLILIQNLHYQVCHILYLRNLNADERTICHLYGFLCKRAHFFLNLFISIMLNFLKPEAFSRENSIYLDPDVNGLTFIKAYGPIDLERKKTDFGKKT